MKKYFATLLVTLGLSLLASYHLVVEQDIVSSLELKNEHERAAYNFFHEKSAFLQQIFIFDQSLSQEERIKIDEFMAENSYQKRDWISLGADQAQAITELSGMLSPKRVDSRFQEEYLDLIVKKAQELAALPGSGPLLKDLSQDPFGLKDLVLEDMGVAKIAGKKVETFSRTAPLDYDKVARVFDHLLSLGQKIAFIGGDFFSLANYQAVRDDINSCIGWSLFLNLALFYYFCRKFNLVILLALGTALSYAAGLGLLRIFYSQVYAIVLAFTSTFIGFNNEYLVHFSGLKAYEEGSSKVGLGSAIGTTLIGFVVLLFGESVLIRQMALISIGGLISFIVMMLLFQDKVGEIRFKSIKLPSWHIKGPHLIIATLALLLALTILPKPEFTTNIEDFSYHSKDLKESVAFFGAQGYGSNFEAASAIPIKGSIEETWALHASGNAKHPMHSYVSIAKQEENIKYLKTQMQIWLPKLKMKLNEQGLPLKLAPYVGKTLLAADYLLIWNKISPTPVYFPGPSPYLYLVAAKIPSQEIIPLAPKLHYNRLLTQLEQNMGFLFGIGLVIMFFYLIPWQSRLDKICYIFMPLLLTVLVCLLLFKSLAISVNIIHIMGFSLVIALALDYSAVAISSNFSKQEQGKILLTGLSALTTFGVISLAKHPVLRDLGLVVFIGALVSLVFSLIIRTKASHV